MTDDEIVAIADEIGPRLGIEWHYSKPCVLAFARAMFAAGEAAEREVLCEALCAEIEFMPKRQEALGGQWFAYVKAADILDLIRARQQEGGA